jgi:hypothetical protein
VSGGPDTCAVYGVSAGSVTISAWVNDIADSVSIAVIAATGP